MCVRAHTHGVYTLPLKWKLWLSTVLVFLPLYCSVRQTDKALSKVQCTRLLLHCHQKPLTKCLISLWGYLCLVHWPDGTFSSGTRNFPFDHLCCIKSGIGHNICIENSKILAFFRWLSVFKLVTLTGTHSGEGLPPSPPCSSILPVWPSFLIPPVCNKAKGTCLLSVRFHLKIKIILKATLTVKKL